ncbi:MAG: hypothetical protein ACLQUY_29395 [Ktedonobacterales bacterium]
MLKQPGHERFFPGDHAQPEASVKLSALKLEPNATNGTSMRAENQEIPNRGHSLIIDHGWRGVAELAFIKEQLQTSQ